jgi:hypothetical protein
VNDEPQRYQAGQPAPAATGRSHALRGALIDIVAPIAVYYVARALGASVWVALIAGGAMPAIGVLAGLLRRRRPDAMGILVLAALAVSALASVVNGSPRALLARDGLTTGAWACYMYLSLLAARPATFVGSRPLLEGRRVFDQATRRWVRPAAVSWDDLWARLPRFRRIWRVCTVIWARPSSPTRSSASRWPPHCRSGSSPPSAGRCGPSRSSLFRW